MNRILMERRDDIAVAMRGLCDAVGRLSLVRDELANALVDVPHGHESERIALEVNRAVERMTMAAASVPKECWDIMSDATSAGGHELNARMVELISQHLTVKPMNFARAS